jgi:hypothetical protein
MSADPKFMKPPMGCQIDYEIFWRKQETEHLPVDIYVSREDSIHWFCRDKKFRVKCVHPGKETPDAPTPLFYRLFPEDNPTFAYHVNSGPVRPETAEEGKVNVYKPVFEFEGGGELDPHIRTHTGSGSGN